MSPLFSDFFSAMSLVILFANSDRPASLNQSSLSSLAPHSNFHSGLFPKTENAGDQIRWHSSAMIHPTTPCTGSIVAMLYGFLQQQEVIQYYASGSVAWKNQSFQPRRAGNIGHVHLDPTKASPRLGRPKFDVSAAEDHKIFQQEHRICQDRCNMYQWVPGPLYVGFV